MKTALITGISGQDGSLLAELLLTKGYKVTAITHHDLDASQKLYQNYKNILGSIFWESMDLGDTSKVTRFLEKHRPDEVYHLGAQSFPSAGFSDNYSAFEANTRGTYELLAAAFRVNPGARFFFAGSSEIFGDNPQGIMSEEDRFFPKTVYGISKLMGHELVRNYRENMARFAVTGFLFNHESPRRGEEFVTRKITLAAARIKLGLQKKLILGSLDSKRDWSAAEDFVKGFHLSLQANGASDYVFASGELRTVKDFVTKAFETLDLNWKEFVDIDQNFNRPAKFDLRGNSSRARTVLGWQPEISFEAMVERMVKSDYDLVRGAQ